MGAGEERTVIRNGEAIEATADELSRQPHRAGRAEGEEWFSSLVFNKSSLERCMSKSRARVIILHPVRSALEGVDR